MANRNMTVYVLTETGVSVVINVAISIGFVFAQFHGLAAVPTSGPGGLVRDAIPQTFAISLMSVLVPTLLTRKRGRVGAVPAPPLGRRFAPSHVLLRAALIALVAAALGLAFTALVFAHTPGPLPFGFTLGYKACYGALVALVVTPWAVYCALHDVAVQRAPVKKGSRT